MTKEIPSNVAGYWRRWLRSLVLWLLICCTIGIYIIFMWIHFIKGEQNLGMKAAGIKYSNTNQGDLFMYGHLQNLFYILIIPIFIDFVMIIMKKGRFSERWSGNFFVKVK